MIEGLVDGRPITNEQRAAAPVEFDPNLQTSIKGLLASAGAQLSSCRITGNAPTAPGPCDLCLNKCQIQYWGGVLATSSQLISGDWPGALLALGGTFYGIGKCINDCTQLEALVAPLSAAGAVFAANPANFVVEPPIAAMAAQFAQPTPTRGMIFAVPRAPSRTAASCSNLEPNFW